MVSVVDESGDRGQVVPLGNRQNPIGSANIEYHGLFVTADEHAVLESGNPSNTAWIMGFMIDPHRSANIREKYRDLEYPVPVIMDGKPFRYYRNFPLQETCALQSLIYIAVQFKDSRCTVQKDMIFGARCKKT
jgi:hypothetical protein